LKNFELTLAPEIPEVEDSGAHAGFRLSRFEVYNWGTFHKEIWGLDLQGNNALLTGDIGSGKSTFVDAITTLLIAPQKIIYNKAAGAEGRERNLKSYVYGHYKSERSDSGLSVRPVALRDHASYSVILGRFYNRDLHRFVTLAQVFWIKDVQEQPARLYVTADLPLSIKEHFARFGSDIKDLRKRLRGMPQVEVFDSFPPYGSAYRRRFGIDNEQALDLFNQTVSMKSVGNLTDFVREHMLEPFPVETRITALLHHFSDLNRAHEAVLKAKDQIERLTPLVNDCNQLDVLSTQVERLRTCSQALRPWFALLKQALLQERLEQLNAEVARLAARIESIGEERNTFRIKRDDLKRAIAESGGHRLEQIQKDISEKNREKDQRSARAGHYRELASSIGLPGALDSETFAENQRAITAEQQKTEARQAENLNAHSEAHFALRQLTDLENELKTELESLRQRRSNIPKRSLDLRQQLCRATGWEEEGLPFAGELIQVRPEDRDWEGAIERLLHNFSLSLLVPDGSYASVAGWVDRTHLGGRLVYYRVREQRAVDPSTLHPHSLLHKISVKPHSVFYNWLEAEMSRRFDYACCESLDLFRRERQAITRSGQIKGAGERHEKDDRYRVDDRSHFVLGWSNESKIAALERQARDLEKRVAVGAKAVAVLNSEMKALQARLGTLQQLTVYRSFRELEWQPLALEIERLEGERRELQEGSDALRTLSEQLAQIEKSLDETEKKLAESQKQHYLAEAKGKEFQSQLSDCEALQAETPRNVKDRDYPQLDALRIEAIGAITLTVESCDKREREMREWLQGRIDAQSRKMESLREQIVKAMQSYRAHYSAETQEVDASTQAAGEYRTMLNSLQSDDLPRFEARFKELLNENTIREIANFQSQLNRERETIRERIHTINRSLHAIDYNQGRYITVQAEANSDAEIRDFQQDLRACTEGTLTGSQDAEYSEAKFLQVKRIIERFRGRAGSEKLDERWRTKVTDVRYWFTFSASERWREDDREFEHYTDSGGKSGGQKEKLAYTVLAASLAYQFGLEEGADRLRSFRFVVIDEAFGRGSDESAQYGLRLFKKLNLQLLIITPLQKIHVIEPYIQSVGFVHNEEGRYSKLRNLTIEEFRAKMEEFRMQGAARSA
jgi:uncharacterized protein YPO0396